MKKLNRFLSRTALRLTLGGVLTMGGFIASPLRATGTELIAQAVEDKTQTSTASLEGATSTQDSTGTVTERTGGLIYSGESGGLNVQGTEGFLGVTEWISDGRTIVPSDPDTGLSILILNGTDVPSVFGVEVRIGETGYPGLLKVDEQSYVASDGVYYCAVILLDLEERGDLATQETACFGYIKIKKLNSGG